MMIIIIVNSANQRETSTEFEAEERPGVDGFKRDESSPKAANRIFRAVGVAIDSFRGDVCGVKLECIGEYILLGSLFYLSSAE